MYAIVESGGRQYRAEEGHSFSVEKLAVEVGEQIELSNVFLLANDEDVQVGQPTVPGASVKATIVEQYRGKKIFVWKYKPKKRYRRRFSPEATARSRSRSPGGSIERHVTVPGYQCHC